MTKKCLKFIVIFIMATNVTAQSSWTSYNTTNSGIVGDFINQLVIDSQGNKWIGTKTGLSMFDGLIWTTYNSTNSGLGENYINQIIIDTEGNKWIATNAGLSNFDGSTWINYNTGNCGISSNFINQIVIDSQGNKWIGTKFGLNKFDGKSWASYNAGTSGIASDYINHIAVDSQGVAWVSCAQIVAKTFSGKGLSKFDGTTWTTYNTSNSGISSNNIYQIVIDSHGNKWIATNEGLNMFDGTTWTTYNTSNSGIANDYINQIVIDSDGNKWIGTNSGLCKFDGKTWTTYDTGNSGIAGNNVMNITIDSQGNKWLSSGFIIPRNVTSGPRELGVGISKFDGLLWTKYNTKNSWITGNETYQIAIDPQGNKWIGTNNGLSILSGAGNSSLCSTQKNILLKHNKTCVLEDATVSISSKEISNNYKYLWSGIDTNNNIIPIKVNNQNQINVSKQGFYTLRVEDSDCFIKDSIYASPMDTIGIPPSQKIILTDYTSKCSNSYVTFYNPYPKTCKIEWLDGNSTIISNNQDYLLSYNNNTLHIKVYDSLCQKAYQTYFISANVHDTILNTPSICMVTNQNGKNMLIWENVNNNFIDKFRVYKQNQLTSNYDFIHEQSKHQLSHWIDSLSQPNANTERYKISVIDTCGRESLLSNNHSTVLLSSNVGLNGTVNLAWNAYEGFSYSNFEIWRSIDGINFNMLSTVANNTFAYIDNNPSSTAWYQIRITKQDACNPLVRSLNSVNSNIISKEGKSLGVIIIQSEIFDVFPNPTSDILIIKSSNNQESAGYVCKIVDLQGRELLKTSINTLKTEISLKTLGSKGVYVLHIIDANNTSIENKKIVLE